MFSFKLTPEKISKAKWFESFRLRCKEYLKECGADHDKFTVVSHDSYIGYISELYIKELIRSNYSRLGFEVRSWDDDFDLDEIDRIVTLKNHSIMNDNLVKKYFYDPYDILITKDNFKVYLDVKTALTMRSPSREWDFMYPVVQARKKGKDYMVLAYFITNDGKAYGSFKEIELIGFIGEKQIKKCKIIWKGMYTKFHTKSQINNFETNLSRDYIKFDDLFIEYRKYFRNNKYAREDGFENETRKT